MAEAGWEQVEHTADLALRAWAPDLRGLIEQAARGLIALLIEGEAPPAESTVEIRVQGDSAEELLHDALREVLLLAPLEGLAPVSVRVTAAEEGGRRWWWAWCSVGASADLHLQEIRR